MGWGHGGMDLCGVKRGAKSGGGCWVRAGRSQQLLWPLPMARLCRGCFREGVGQGFTWLSFRGFIPTGGDRSGVAKKRGCSCAPTQSAAACALRKQDWQIPSPYPPSSPVGLSWRCPCALLGAAPSPTKPPWCWAPACPLQARCHSTHAGCCRSL